MAALGSWRQLAGYELVGVEVVAAEDPEEVCRAWGALPDDVAVVLLTPEARSFLPDRLLPADRLWAVIPG
jgi:vacuolar-type H+-ATPase subunit F/Vma7